MTNATNATNATNNMVSGSMFFSDVTVSCSNARNRMYPNHITSSTKTTNCYINANNPNLLHILDYFRVNYPDSYWTANDHYGHPYENCDGEIDYATVLPAIYLHGSGLSGNAFHKILVAHNWLMRN